METYISNERSAQLQEEAMRRMRWRLWFAFRDSKYDQFKYMHKGNVYPNYAKIKEYCLRHWGKEIKDMGYNELSNKISIVLKWKD